MAVSHQDQAGIGFSAQPGRKVQAIAQVHAVLERDLGRVLDGRTFGDRVGKGNPKFEHVGAAGQGGAGQFPRLLERG